MLANVTTYLTLVLTVLSICAGAASLTRSSRLRSRIQAHAVIRDALPSGPMRDAMCDLVRDDTARLLAPADRYLNGTIAVTLALLATSGLSLLGVIPATRDAAPLTILATVFTWRLIHRQRSIINVRAERLLAEDTARAGIPWH